MTKRQLERKAGELGMGNFGCVSDTLTHLRHYGAGGELLRQAYMDAARFDAAYYDATASSRREFNSYEA